MRVYSKTSLLFSEHFAWLGPMRSTAEREPDLAHGRQGEVCERQLQAYVDDMLPPHDRRRVEDYLRRHPEEFARVEVYRAQTKALCILFGRSPTVLPPALRELSSQFVKAVNRASEFQIILSVAVVIFMSLVGIGVSLSIHQ